MYEVVKTQTTAQYGAAEALALLEKSYKKELTKTQANGGDYHAVTIDLLTKGYDDAAEEFSTLMAYAAPLMVQ
ncbi:MAG TPA: hypothetical protein VD999_05145 [Vitreimonas sp.]|nr:hypothetical protein [Vitreimonas sp.]